MLGDSFDDVVLVSFGGPRVPDDVMPFLRNVTRGRGIPEERLEEVAEHYYHFGGQSPINVQNDALAIALGEQLSAQGHTLPVWIGNRNWDPYLSDVLREAYDAGCRRMVALVTSSYASYSSCRQYQGDIDQALQETGLVTKMEVVKNRQFFNHRGFITPFVEGLTAALDQLAASLPDLVSEDVEVIFTGHSLPTGLAASSGYGQWRSMEGGAYCAQHMQVAQCIADLCHEARCASPGLGFEHWQLAWQSRSGSPSQRWVEPDVNDVIRQLAHEGRSAVVTVPISFISDHMEVVWDLDNEAAQTASSVGLGYGRAATPGTHPVFIDGLVKLLVETSDGVCQEDYLGSSGPWPEVCPRDCCPAMSHTHSPREA